MEETIIVFSKLLLMKTQSPVMVVYNHLLNRKNVHGQTKKKKKYMKYVWPTKCTFDRVKINQKVTNLMCQNVGCSLVETSGAWLHQFLTGVTKPYYNPYNMKLWLTTSIDTFQRIHKPLHIKKNSFILSSNPISWSHLNQIKQIIHI